MFNTNEIDVYEKVSKVASKLKAKFSWLTDLFPKPNQFNKLPTEIISEIIKHLDNPRELIVLSSVSSRFYKICNDIRIWQHFGFASKKEYLELLNIRKKGLTITTIGTDGLYSETPTMKAAFFKQLAEENNHKLINHYSYSVLGWNIKINDFSTDKTDIIFVLPDNLNHFDEICEKIHSDLESPTSNKHYFFMIAAWGAGDIINKIENLQNSRVNFIPCMTERWGEITLTKPITEILEIVLSKVLSAEKFHQFQMLHHEDCQAVTTHYTRQSSFW